MSEKIVQTAGRDSLGEFAPMFAHLNDDVLFGEVWNEDAIPVKTKCIITVVSLMASGITDSSFRTMYHISSNYGFLSYLSFGKCKKEWGNKRRNSSSHYPCDHVCRMAERMGGIPSG